MKTIDKIYDTIMTAFSAVRKPLMPISAALIAGGSITRPGLSAIMIASNIIRRQSEAGAYFGPLKDGSANVSEAMERIRVEEIVKAIKEDMKVEIAIPPGGISITGTGNALGIPAINITGTNINPVHGDGIAR